MNAPTGTKKSPNDVKIGDIVLYSMDQGRHAGETRPAIVVNIFPQTAAPGQETSPPLLNLQVFVDGRNDGFDSDETGTVWKTSRKFSPDQETGTWCLPAAIATETEQELTTAGGYDRTYPANGQLI
jgi:hypothetical protein